MTNTLRFSKSVKNNDTRMRLSLEIKERAATHLFNHKETLIEYEEFIRDAVKYSRRNKKLPEDWKALQTLS